MSDMPPLPKLPPHPHMREWTGAESSAIAEYAQTYARAYAEARFEAAEQETAALQKELGECSGGYQTLEREVAALRADAEADAKRVLFVADMMDGIGDIDFHEQAAIFASVFGRDEANSDDYLAAVRTAIDAARAATGTTP